MPMQHLNEDAKTAIQLANEIARDNELEYVGTEHVLLGILQHGGTAVKILSGFGIDEPKARKAIDDIVRHDKEDTWVFGRLPGSPHFKNVIALAIDEAKQLGCEKIGSEHLLLALIREKQSTAERALKNLGMSLKTAREAVAKAATA